MRRSGPRTGGQVIALLWLPFDTHASLNRVAAGERPSYPIVGVDAESLDGDDKKMDTLWEIQQGTEKVSRRISASLTPEHDLDREALPSFGNSN